MTELLTRAVDVRARDDGMPASVRIDGIWCAVCEVMLTWRVDTDWWCSAVRRDYMRCLLDSDDCVDVCRDLVSGEWSLVRRYD